MRSTIKFVSNRAFNVNNVCIYLVFKNRKASQLEVFDQ